MIFRTRKSKQYNTLTRATRGYTLIEILVCLVIIMVITMITRQSKTQYERSIFLTNLAYDVALTVREAQVYATNVRRISSSGIFDRGYGVEFKTGTTFTLFVDANDNRYYDPTAERLRDYSIRNNNKILQICLVHKTAGTTCGYASVQITFRRPDTEACISTTALNSTTYKSSASCFELPTPGFIESQITLAAPNGNTRLVRIFSNGYVSVQ